MDHFNITLQKDGQLVATRRGLHVSKTKHRGLSFVNSSCPRADAPRPRAAPPKLARPLVQCWRFVTKDKEPRKAAARAKVKAGDKAAKDTAVDTSGCSRQGSQPPKSGTGTVNHLPTPAPAPHKLGSVVDRLSTPSSTSSSSSYESARDDCDSTFSQAQDFCAVAPGVGGMLNSLPVWTSARFPIEQDLPQFFRFYSLVPRKMFPFEDVLSYNPARSRDLYWSIINDHAAWNCVLLCHAMFAAVLAGKPMEDELAYRMAKICSIINNQLDKRPARVPDITLDCITTLALMGNLLGRHDHWHVHLTGLKKMVELNGGWKDVRPALISKIQRTDIKGAATLGTTPYLPFTRSHENISNILPVFTRTETSRLISTLLAPLPIAPIVTASITALSLFLQAFSLAQHASPPRSLLFDPHAFAEELNWVQHQLTTHPGPLRAAHAPPPPPPLDPADTRPGTHDFVGNHRAPLAEPVLPAPDRPPVEAALRIAALLLLKELVPDFPRNLGGYAVLLRLLRQHSRELGREAARGGAAAARLRPVVLWVCLVGDVVSRVADGNEARAGGECYERGVFAEGVTAVLEGVESGVEGLGEGELVLCGLLDLRQVRGEMWDDRAGLARMLVERRGVV